MLFDPENRIQHGKLVEQVGRAQEVALVEVAVEEVVFAMPGVPALAQPFEILAQPARIRSVDGVALHVQLWGLAFVDSTPAGDM